MRSIDPIRPDPIRPDRSAASDRHARLADCWHHVAALDPADRCAELDRLERDDASLGRELRELLRFDPGVQPRPEGTQVREFFDLLRVEDAFIDAAPPERIGPAIIESEIGRGSSGVVYAGRLEHPPRRVAVKVLASRPLDRADDRRTQQEARLLARLQHPGIAHVLDAGMLEEQGTARPWLVMELVEGTRIDRHVAERAPTTEAIVELVIQLCDAVEHAHRRGVLHRDLKPANIVVEGGGEETPRVRVLDFGVARLIESEEEGTIGPTLGGVAGTPAYMSPEQLRGSEEKIDTRSDVWSIGAIAWELLAGRRAVQVGAKGTIAQIQAALRAEIPRLGAFRPDARGDLETVVHAALAQDPDRRYGSAAQLAADLRRVLARAPIAARPPTRRYLAGRFVARHRAATGIAAGLLAALLLGIAGTGIGLHQARRERDERTRDLQESLALLVQVVPMIESRPGTAAAREQLLSEIVERIAPLAEAPDASDALRADYATALCQIGAVDLERKRFDDASSRFDRALAIRRELAAARPESSMLAREVSFCLVRLGDVWRAREAPEVAELLYDEAFGIDLALHHRRPQDRVHADDVAWGYERRASIRRWFYDYEAARRMQRQRLAIVDAILEREPDQVSALHGRAAALSELAVLLSDPGLAEVARRESIETFRHLRRIAPHEARSQHELANGLLELVRSGTGTQAERNQLVDEAEGLARVLVAMAPEAEQNPFLLARVLRERARIRLTAGDAQEALAHLAEAEARILAISSSEWRQETIEEIRTLADRARQMKGGAPR